MKIPPIGLYDTQIQQALTTQLTNMATKGTPPDKAFADAMADRSIRSPAESPVTWVGRRTATGEAAPHARGIAAQQMYDRRHVMSESYGVGVTKSLA